MKKCILLLLSLSSFSFLMAQTPDWTRQIGDLINKVDWMKQSDYGYLVCGTGNGIYCVNNVSGDMVWANKDLPMGINTEKSEFISGTPYRLVYFINQIIFETISVWRGRK